MRSLRRIRLRPLPFNIYTVGALAVLFGLYTLLSWRFMSGLPVDVHSLETFSALLALAGTLAWLFGRPFLAGILYTILGAGGTGGVWDRWSRASGHWNKVQALWSSTPLTRDGAEALIFHTPFLLLGLVLILWYRTKRPSA